jgi:ATP-binding cassette subfamily B protein
MNRYQAYRQKQKNMDRAENAKGTLKRFVLLLKPFWPLVLLVSFCALTAAVLNTLSPKMMGDVVDAISDQVDVKLAGGAISFEPIKMTLLNLFLIYFVSSIMQFIQQYTLAGISQKLVCSLRGQVNEKLSRLPLKYFDRNTKGEILSKIINDCDNLSNTLQTNITTVITNSVQFVGALAIMLYYSATLSAIPIAFLPVSMAISFGFSRISKKLFRKHWEQTGELNGHVEEMYTGHNIVKIFGRETASVEEFNEINENLYHITRKANFVSGVAAPLLRLVNNITFLLFCIVGGIMIIKGSFKLGTVTSFIQYANMFSSPVTNIGNIINTIQSALASAERVFRLLDEEEEPQDAPKYELLEQETEAVYFPLPKAAETSQGLQPVSGAVAFEDVSFRYLENKPLIDNMHIRVEPGQLAAIVGPTGAGKTTFVNLLMRFYDVCGGAITVDGIDIRDLSRNNLRSLFGMVLQDTWLFRGTIKENIAYGREGATDEEVIEAAKAAKVHHFIETLPEGYETQLDEEGSNISQGQRQLLTIARALLADPDILILDEATSSVDTRTELQIQEAMKTLMANRTNFVIAHRLSTIKMADVILVMRQGKIVEQGTHSDLIAQEGFYAALYHSQYTGGIPPEDGE